MIVKRVCICFFAFFTFTFIVFGAFSIPDNNPNSYNTFSSYTQTKSVYPNLETVTVLVSSLSDTLNEFSFEEMMRDYNLPVQSNWPLLDVTASFVLDRLKPFIFIFRFAGNVVDIIRELSATLSTYRLTI